MTDRPAILVGYVPVLPSRHDFAPGSMILIEEPDVIRKRGVADQMASAPAMRELAAWEYQRPGAADEFHAARPDLDPALIVPLVEYAVPFAADLAERYGVPGATSRAARILRDKAMLREVTRAAGVANPRSNHADGPDDVRRFIAAYGAPVVLKPANRQASLGTKVLSDPAEVDAAWVECADQDEGVMVPDRGIPLRMLVEEYVRGTEYSVEMLVHHGVPLFTNITGKMLFPGPRPIELGHVVPAELPEATADRLRRSTTAVLRAIGFGSGIVHCEWIVRDSRPYLVECAGRFPGDGIPELIARAYPIDLVDHYHAVMRGERPPPLPERAERAAAVRFLRADPGEVVSVSGVDDAEATPGVVHASVSVVVGDHVGELRSSWDRVGSVLACAATAGEAMKQAETAADALRVETRGR